MKIRLILLFGLLGLTAFAQETPNFEVPNFAPKTPEAAAFLKYGEYPVDLSTGVPNISIPLYTIEDKGFSIPITLNYHASGIKVNQEATWVGLGWNLNFGAQIILSPLDGIDQPNQFIDDVLDLQDLDDYFDGHPYDFSGNYNGHNLDASRIKDMYNFSSPTASGSFYIRDKDTGDIVIFPPDAFKVEITNSQTQYLKFKITDVSGNIYFFDHTAEKSLRTLTHNDSYISAWYVDEIQTPKGNSITFEYEADGQLEEHSFSQRVEIRQEGKNCNCGSGQEFQDIASSVIDEGSTVFTASQKIKEIVFNDGLSKVVFVKQGGRQDLKNENSQLERIEVRHMVGGSFIVKKGYTFEYSYFDGGYSPLVYKSKRLKLDAIATLIEGEAHEFVYSDIGLPLKNSYAKDYYGYYNAQSNVDMIPKHFLTNPFNLEVGHANKNVNPAVLQAGILKEIHYPTKGWAKFNYEPNEYFGVDEFDRYTLRTISHNDVVGTGTAPTHENNIMEEGIDGPYCVLSANDCPQVQSVPFTFNHSSGTMTFTIYNPTTVHYEYTKVRMYINGVLINTSQSSNPTPGAHTFNFSDLTGSGEVILEAYGSGMKIEGFQLRFVNNDPTPKNLYGGGLRVESIENLNHDNNLISKKGYVYIDPSDSSKTSGRLVNDMITSFTTNAFTNISFPLCPCLSGPPCPSWQGVNYDVVYNITSDSRYGTEGNSVVYEHVKEKNINIADASDNGFTKYQFDISPDYNPWGNPTVQIPASWKRGKVLLKEVFKTEAGNDYPIRIETNKYVEDSSKVSFIDGVKIFRHGNVPYVTPAGGSPLVATDPFNRNMGGCYVPTDAKMIYEAAGLHMPIPWFYLKNTEIKENFYDAANNLVSTITTDKTYNYNNPAHQQLSNVVKVNSKGESLETKYYYPQDSAMSGEPQISEFVAKNMIATPLKVETLNGGHLLAEKKTVYAKDTSTGNLLLPKFVYTKKADGTPEREITYDKYDADGTLLQYTIENGITVSLLWDYKNIHPVAKIENMAYDNIPANLISAIKNASSGTQNDQINALNNLRNDSLLAEAMVTTYTYAPLFGVSSITDPKGTTTYYGYDAEGRLTSVRDADGNYLSQSIYHFKN